MRAGALQASTGINRSAALGFPDVLTNPVDLGYGPPGCCSETLATRPCIQVTWVPPRRPPDDTRSFRGP